MENIEDKDKTIAILRHQYRREVKENKILKEEIAMLEFEIEKLRNYYNLSDDNAYWEIINGESSITCIK